ncbi:MAG TPA: response regulator transcription factor [Ktedonobacteraceae bacterium]|nr:response regulator transcription factor [Ktedonobacteraceae bacterium]
MIRVFVLAPAPMMRAGLQTMLTTADIQVVGESAEPAGLLGTLPDIDVLVVADEKTLEDVARAIRSSRSGDIIAIVALSNSDEYAASILRSLSLSGWSIVPLDVSTAQLQAVIVAAAQGFVTLPAPAAERILGQSGQRVPVEAMHIDAPDEPLTSREREVLEMLSRGLSNKMIARRLSISEHTVKFHVSSIYTKLGAASRTDAVSRGVRRGLITL